MIAKTLADHFPGERLFPPEEPNETDKESKVHRREIVRKAQDTKTNARLLQEISANGKGIKTHLSIPNPAEE
jgi:hypothetical protein